MYPLPHSEACPYCSSDNSQVYHGGKCPKVKKIKYYPDGTIKEVEFHEEEKSWMDHPGKERGYSDGR